LDILENISLAAFTTFSIGGPARWFAEARGEEEIVEAVDWAHRRGLSLFVLGGGSNLLVSDAGFDGLVLRVGLRGIEARPNGVLSAAAGEPWDDCVERSTVARLAGIECLAGIPGTVGGTPVQNVGAYGQEVASVIDRVRAYDLDARAFVEFTAGECGFAYRQSRFNTRDKGRFIVTRVDYRLRPGGAPLLAYADLKQHFREWKQGPALAEVAEAVRGIRRAKGMLVVEGDADCRSAGSFFKNPTVPQEIADRVREFAADRGLALRAYPAGDGGVKIPAAWLIEQAGFPKGFARGRAGISSRHTLALINRGGATAADVLGLAAEIRASVEAQFGIRLEQEPVLVGC
jgi:UDP-N-acetylmuramate dehydrogenase